MTPILIDLNDYVRTGEGANGASFNHKTDSSIMMKLYFRNYEAAELELELARKVYAAGIPTPEPGDLVTDGERIGIRFRRLMDKKSFSRACGDNPEKTEVYAKEFAQMCLQLHNTHVDTTVFENVKDRLYAMLEKNPDFTPLRSRRSMIILPLRPMRIRLSTEICSSVMVFLCRPARNTSSTWAISATAFRCSTWEWFICAAV